MSRYFRDEEINLMAVLKDAVPAVLVLFVLLVFWPIASVPTGSRGVITVGGQIKGIESEGYLVVWPWQKLSIFNIRAEKADIDKAEGATSDTQPVSVSLTVRYNISPDRVSEVFEKYSHDGDLSSYIQTATQEIFKAVTAKYTAPDLISKRALVSSDIYTALSAKVAQYGAHIINIDMRNFAFNPQYMTAINAKVEQEQLKLVAQNKLLTVEAEQKQKVAIAEAEANAVKATADGAAYARLTNATAEAKSVQVEGEASARVMQLQGDALAKNPQLVEMKKAEKWNGQAVPTNVFGQTPVPILGFGGSK
jgi:prohibitin 2